jgi:hypothetical protein
MSAIHTTYVLAGRVIGTSWDGEPMSRAFFYHSEQRPKSMRDLVATVIDRERDGFNDPPRFSPESVLTIIRWGLKSGHRGRSWRVAYMPSLNRDITIYSWEPDFRELDEEA